MSTNRNFTWKEFLNQYCDDDALITNISQKINYQFRAKLLKLLKNLFVD